MNTVDVPCPDCGNDDADRLEWIDDERVQCTECGRVYELLKQKPN